MDKVKILLKNERGFLLLNVIFLTLITSFAAMILLNANQRVKNPQATLRLTALYLANEQFAQLESLAADGKPLEKRFLGKEEDLTIENAGSIVNFDVETNWSNDENWFPEVNDENNLRKIKVTVKWTVNGKDFEIESERTIWLAKENDTQ